MEFKIRNNGYIEATVDHVIPKSKGGTEEWGNLQLLCALCNSLKGDSMP